jgi:hypothetical protein
MCGMEVMLGAAESEGGRAEVCGMEVRVGAAESGASRWGGG